jgi:protoporphyrinogen oxidase
MSEEMLLQQEGFSEEMIDRFFRPFLGGIFFDRDLTVTSRLFTFVMRMLASGRNSLPEKGIGSVTQQLASALPSSMVFLNTRVTSVTPETESSPAAVSTAEGRLQAAKGVVVAVEGPEACSLLSGRLQSVENGLPGVGTCCVYFSCSAERLPSEEGILYLDGGGCGIVNNACFPSNVAASYAPAGKALVSASTVGTHDNLSDEQLVEVRSMRSILDLPVRDCLPSNAGEGVGNVQCSASLFACCFVE